VLRDVISVPAEGWAKIRFVADNPGVWLLHCHMDWHVRAGFLFLFI
jgi:laccase